MAVRYMRDQAPSSYLLTINSFSESIKSGFYESSVFEFGGYKWLMTFYPRGRSYYGGKDHISIFLEMHHTNSLPLNWEVNVELKLFIKNQREDKFLTVQDGDFKRYNTSKREWGYEKMLPISTFDDSSNGYLVNDSCVVGVEIFVVNPSDKQETVTFMRSPPDGKFTWKISKFSKLDLNIYETDVFIVGEMKWKISFHPKTYNKWYGANDTIAFLLWNVGSAEDKAKANTWVRVKLRLLDQINSRHYEKQDSGYYPSDASDFRGRAEFITVKELNDPSRGFLVNDRLIVEADLEVVSVTKVVPN